MGTSKERSKDEEEEPIIPWACVPYSVRQELIKKLNPDMTMSGNDWRMLASELEYTTGDINYIESVKDNNTSYLFRQYDTRPGASLNQVRRSLKNMQRHDCLEILKNAEQEIQQAFNRATESQQFHMGETSEMFMSRQQYQRPSASCPYSYPHHPNAPYSGHACGPCSHSFTCCGGAGHSSHVGPCHAHLTHSHHSVCQPFSLSNTAEKTCGQSFSSPCHSTSPVHSYLMNPQSACNVAQSISSSSPALQQNCPNIGLSTSGNILSGQHGRTGMSPGHVAYQASPPYGFNQNVNNIALPSNINALDTSNFSSSDSNNSDSLNIRQKIARQYSDECNVIQSSNGDKRFRNNSNGAVAVDSGYSANPQRGVPQGLGHLSNIGAKLTNNQNPKFFHLPNATSYMDHGSEYYPEECEVKVRNGPEFETKFHPNALDQSVCGEAKTNLALLEKLAAVPDKFKPTEEYKTVVAEQKINENKRSRDGKGSLDSSSSNSSGSSSGRNHPSTFPMRVKIKQERGMEDLKNLTISKKSTSLPQNMKPVEYRKAFRHIKVFVTYSYDSDTHGKQVLSLCKFLQSNGFACCVDVSVKNSTGSLEQLEWCRKKVTEADFILVCISHKYLEDISSDISPSVSQDNKRQLHTQEIYELMNAEFLNSQHGCGEDGSSGSNHLPRFIPLLFSQMAINHVPSWMMNGPVYNWPEQYNDLAWMLTKPQERIRQRRETHEQ